MLGVFIDLSRLLLPSTHHNKGTTLFTGCNPCSVDPFSLVTQARVSSPVDWAVSTRSSMQHNMVVFGRSFLIKVHSKHQGSQMGDYVV